MPAEDARPAPAPPAPVDVQAVRERLERCFAGAGQGRASQALFEILLRYHLTRHGARR